MYDVVTLIKALNKANEEIETLTSSREELRGKYEGLLIAHLNLQEEVSDLLRFKLEVLTGTN